MVEGGCARCTTCCQLSVLPCTREEHQLRLPAAAGNNSKCRTATCIRLIAKTPAKACGHCLDCCLGNVVVSRACKYATHQLARKRHAAVAAAVDDALDFTSTAGYCAEPACHTPLSAKAAQGCKQHRCADCCTKAKAVCSYHMPPTQYIAAKTVAAASQLASDTLRALEAGKLAEHLCAFLEEERLAKCAAQDAAILGTSSTEAFRRDVAGCDERRISLGLHAREWPNVGKLMASFQGNMAESISKMQCCCECGSTVLGGLPTAAQHQKYVPSPGDGPISPYAKAWPYMAPYTIDASSAPRLVWWRCRPCASPATRILRKKWLVPFTEDYTQVLLQPGLACLENQGIALVDIRVQLTEHWSGFAQGRIGAGSLLNSAYIQWSNSPLALAHQQAPAVEAARQQHDPGINNVISQRLELLLALNITHNPLYHQFLCVLEHPHPHLGFPAVSPAIVKSFLPDHQARGPTQEGQTADHRTAGTLGLAYTLHNVTSQRLQDCPKFNIGSIHLRSAAMPRRRRDLIVNADGTPPTLLNNVSAEAAVFAMLFPQGTGFFLRMTNANLTDYLNYRFSCFFSPFTLEKTYILAMYQIRQVVVYVNSLRNYNLEEELCRFMLKNPTKTRQVNIWANSLGGLE